MDGWKDGWMDGWMYMHLCICMYVCICMCMCGCVSYATHPRDWLTRNCLNSSRTAHQHTCESSLSPQLFISSCVPVCIILLSYYVSCAVFTQSLIRQHNNFTNIICMCLQLIEPHCLPFFVAFHFPLSVLCHPICYLSNLSPSIMLIQLQDDSTAHSAWLTLEGLNTANHSRCRWGLTQ